MTEKIAVFRIVWKIPRKSRLESRIKSTKNEVEGRIEFPGVKGIDTEHKVDNRYPEQESRNEFPGVKGIDTAIRPKLCESSNVVEMSSPR